MFGFQHESNSNLNVHVFISIMRLNERHHGQNKQSLFGLSRRILCEDDLIDEDGSRENAFGFIHKLYIEYIHDIHMIFYLF